MLNAFVCISLQLITLKICQVEHNIVYMLGFRAVRMYRIMLLKKWVWCLVMHID